MKFFGSNHASSTVLVATLLILLQPVLGTILGIDLGQAYTKSCIVAPEAPFDIVLTADSKRKDLSAITFKDIPGGGENNVDIQRIYGNSASSLLSRFPAQSPFFLKELLGVEYDSEAVSSYSGKFPAIKLVDASTSENKLNARNTPNFELVTKAKSLTLSIEELIAMSFNDLKSRALAMLSSGSKLQDVAITVPHYFNSAQRKAVIDAAEIAKLRVVSLVHDGVAVAVNMASKSTTAPQDTQYHIILDVGAGSTTATLVKMEPGSNDGSVLIDVLGVGSDAGFGGHALTHHMRNVLVDKFVAKNKKLDKAKILADPRAYNRLWQEAERVKIVLSANTETTAHIESLYDDESVSAKISRSDFESSVKHLVSKVQSSIQDIFDSKNLLVPSAADIKLNQVSSIVLTGGSSRVPFVQQQIQDLVQDTPVSMAKVVNADESAVFGATLRGVGISGKFRSKNITVIDRSLSAFDISANGSGFQSVFPRGSLLNSYIEMPLALEEGYTLTLSEDGSPIKVFDVSQVKSTIASMRCVDEKQVSVTANFHLSNSGLVDLTTVEVQCQAARYSSSSSSTSHSSSNTEEGASSTSSSSSSSEGAISFYTARKNLRIKTSYEGVQPVSNIGRQQAIGRLIAWDKVDSERFTRDEARNDLESLIYNVQEKFSEFGHAIVSKISEFAQWLEEEGQIAHISDITAKLSHLQSLAREWEAKLFPSSESTDSTAMSESQSESMPSVKAEENTDSVVSELSKTMTAIVTPTTTNQHPGITQFVTSKAMQEEGRANFDRRVEEQARKPNEDVDPKVRSHADRIMTQARAQVDAFKRLQELRERIEKAAGEASSSSSTVKGHEDL